MAKKHEPDRSVGIHKGEDEPIQSKGMKHRVNNIYNQVCCIENLQQADINARKHKKNLYGISKHDKHRQENILRLHELLSTKTYRTSAYHTRTIFEPKERQISILPYFPDRITHHAIKIFLDRIYIPIFTSDTYSGIKGRGIHSANHALEFALRDISGTQYCLKLDVTKFYPNIDHDILKSFLRRKIKDQDFLDLNYEIIESHPGVPLGSSLSQVYANVYFTPFDYWIKEVMRVRNYFRYCDDIVILSDNKPYLHFILSQIRTYLSKTLKLQVKDNYQVFPVDERGIDVIGYVFFHGYILLRKRIKQDFARMLKHSPNPQSIASYVGWAKHANCKHLLKTLLHE